MSRSCGLVACTVHKCVVSWQGEDGVETKRVVGEVGDGRDGVPWRLAGLGTLGRGHPSLCWAASGQRN